MTTEEWLEKEGYLITMPMTRSNLANIIDRYVTHVASKNFIKPDVIGRFLPSTEDGYQRCANCGKWNSKDEIEKVMAKTLL